MADEKLRIILEVVDKASPGLSSAISSLKIGIGGMVSNLAGVASELAPKVGQALYDGLHIGMQEAMESQVVFAQLSAVLASTGGVAGVTAQAADELANSLSLMTRFDDEAILSAESLLLTFTNISSNIFPAATEAALDMSTAMGQDLKSSVVQIGKALNSPAEGLSALQRVGVIFTKEQENVIKSMVASGDVMGAQKVILQELAKEFGGSAQAAGGTFAGQLDILRNTLQNVAGAIMNAVLPTITDLAGQLVDFVSSDQFQDWIKELASWLQTRLPEAIRTVSDFWTTQLQPAFENFWPVLKNDIIPALSTIFDILGTVAPPILAAFIAGWEIQIKIFEAVKTAVQNTVDAFTYLFDKLKGLKDVLLNLELPDWLTPGSPTPLELGLAGINRAMDELAGNNMVRFQAAFSPINNDPLGAWSRAGGLRPDIASGVQPIVNVIFQQPVIGFSDRYELARELGPIIRDYLAVRR